MRSRTQRITTLLTILLSILSILTVNSQTLRINEFMALNQTEITDIDGDFSDWIELYNPTGSPVHIEGWGITDDVEFPFKWLIPDVTINPDEYLIIYASGKDRRDSNSELHTNFKLSGTGEYLGLVSNSGAAVTEFAPTFPVQQTDFSFGYYEGSYIEFSDPTPGESNILSSGFVVSKPEFSIDHGFYFSPISVEISSTFEGCEIYYTIDGSIPSQVNGELYSSALYVDTTTIIRAIAVSTGAGSSSVATHTYLFPSDIIHQSNNPDGYPAEWGPYSGISGNAIADYEMDPELIADPDFAASVKNGFLELPVISLATDKNHFFSHNTDSITGGIYIYIGSPVGDPIGRGWERPVSMEFFGNNVEPFQINCGVRLHGGHSRLPEKSPKHSFRIVFKSEYGPTKLKYPFFGEEGVTEYNNLVLRAGFGNSWVHHSHEERNRSQYQRDAWTKDTQKDMGHLASNTTYAHLFINGIYWGIYAPSERLDSDFAAQHLGGDPEDYDVMKDYGEVADGLGDAWDELVSIANSGLQGNENYQRIQGNNLDGSPEPSTEPLVDVVNLADYMLINFYGGNTDWDHHNWAAVRNRVKADKGFQFICWDAEHMIKTLNTNVLDENNHNRPSNIFTQLMQNNDYKRLFADRVQRHCYNNGVLTPEANQARWNKRRQQIEGAIDCESARWGDYRRDVHPYQTSGPFELYTKEGNWLPQQEFMANDYFPNRTDVLISQLRSKGYFPNIDAPGFNINGQAISSNIISTGDELSMLAEEGTIYFTMDGSDPVIWPETSDLSEIQLVGEDADKKVTVPKLDIGSSWYTNIGFDDSGWQSCSGSPGGVGYEKGSGYEDFISLDVGNDMHNDGTNPNTSCYIRIPFQITESQQNTLKTLLLEVKYDDGFVAYLNGNEVARVNYTGMPQWNSSASSGHEGNTFETFNISPFINNLNAGENFLAIQGMNTSITSTDFIINATISGSDQVLETSLSDSAFLYDGAFALDQSEHIVARTFLNGEWSAASNKYFIVPEDYYDLKFTEIHYNPLGNDTIGGSSFEFVEIKNTGSSSINIKGLQVVGGIEYTVPEKLELSGGQFIVLSSDENNFFSRYKWNAAGEYTGKLNNDGEWLTLLSPTLDTITAVKYNDNEIWPIAANGAGNSLVPVIINPLNDQNNPGEWRASHLIGGSPGEDDLASVPEYISNITEIKEEIFTQNYPNPFSNTTYIDYELPENAYVRLSVYNVVGQKIITLVDDHQTAGLHQITWDGYDSQNHHLPTGIYFYRLSVEFNNQKWIQNRKMLLLR